MKVRTPAQTDCTLRDAVRKMFADELGVVKWGHEETRFQRPYVTLPIPESILLRVHRRLRQVG